MIRLIRTTICLARSTILRQIAAAAIAAAAAVAPMDGVVLAEMQMAPMGRGNFGARVDSPRVGIGKQRDEVDSVAGAEAAEAEAVEDRDQDLRHGDHVVEPPRWEQRLMAALVEIVLQGGKLLRCEPRGCVTNATALLRLRPGVQVRR